MIGLFQYSEFLCPDTEQLTTIWNQICIQGLMSFSEISLQ